MQPRSMRITALVECDKIFAGDLNTFPYNHPLKLCLLRYIDTFNLANNRHLALIMFFVSKNLIAMYFLPICEDELTAIASDSYPI
jgi:hypothetical protein